MFCLIHKEKEESGDVGFSFKKCLAKSRPPKRWNSGNKLTHEAKMQQTFQDFQRIRVILSY